MTGGQMAGKALQGAFVEDIGNQSHLLVDQDFFAVTGNNAGTFLAAVLEGVEAKIDELGGILVTENPADTTFMPGFYREFLFRYVRVHIHCLQYCQDAPKNRKAQRTFPCACTFVDPAIFKKIMYNQITRFFSTKYRVLSQNIAPSATDPPFPGKRE